MSDRIKQSRQWTIKEWKQLLKFELVGLEIFYAIFFPYLVWATGNFIIGIAYAIGTPIVVRLLSTERFSKFLVYLGLIS